MKFKEFMDVIYSIHSHLPTDTKLPSEDWFKTNIPKSSREAYLDAAFREFISMDLEDSLDFDIKRVKSEVPTEGIYEDTSDTLVGIDETLAERGSNYGKFTTQAELSQKLQVAFDDHVCQHGQPEKYTDSMNEAIQLIIHKLSRIANGNPTYDDSWRDLSGYSTLIVKELNGELI